MITQHGGKEINANLSCKLRYINSVQASQGFVNADSNKWIPLPMAFELK